MISKAPDLDGPAGAAKTAKTAQKPVKFAGKNTDSNVNKIPELPACKIAATTNSNKLIIKSGDFGQILTVNRNLTKITLLWLKKILSNIVSCQRISFLKSKNSEKQKKMPATLTKIAKFTAKLLEDGDVSDEELTQMETKTETTLDISLESISEEDLDGNINLNQKIRGNSKNSLNFLGPKGFSKFSKNFPERRVEDTYKSKIKSQWISQKRVQIFKKFNVCMGNECYNNTCQKSSGKNGTKTKQRSIQIFNKIRTSHTNAILHRKIICYLGQKINAFYVIKFTEDILGAETETEHEEIETDEESEDSEVEMTEEEQERMDRELWKKKFPSGHPPYPVRTPEEIAYWAEWAESRETRLELEKLTEAEGKQPDANVPTEASTSVSAKPAATPKEAGRCKEGDFCSDLMNHSCVYDTSSTVTMESVKSVEYRGLSRTGEERPGTPDPLFDFTLNDLNLLIGGHEDREDAPSVIWTEASVQSTLASVISTDPSIISTQASVTSTIPSVLIIEEVDLRFQCRCGTKMGIQERVATQDFAALNPAPYICYACRWASVGL